MKKLITFLTILFCITGLQAQHGWNAAATFTGDGYLAAWNNSLNSTDDVFTVEFWINPDVEDDAYSIVGKSQFRIMTNHDGTLRIQTGGNTKGGSNAALAKDQWTHVAVVFNSPAESIRIYIDGGLDNTLSYSGRFSATSDSLIVGDSPYADAYSGQLDELRIWRTARTSAEIRYNMRTHISWRIFPYYHSDLVLVQTYEFDVHSLGSLYLSHIEEVGNVDGTHIGTDPSTSVKHNTGIYLDGSSYLEASAADDPDVSLEGPMTVEAWVRPESVGNEQVILDLTDGPGGYELSIDANGKVQWIMNHVGRSSNTLEPMKWYHIAVACETPSNGSQICRIYVNGEEKGAGGYGALQRNTGKLRVGASVNGTNYFKGHVDEVRISNFTKSAQQIKEGLFKPVNYHNKPDAPEITVAYNFDGIIYSGTRDGPALVNSGARFSYASEPSAPLFYMGYQHKELMDSLAVSHAFKEVPYTGTAGYIYDTITVPDSLTVEDIKVFLALSHENMRSIKIELLSPDGNSMALLDRGDATGDMKIITTFFDKAAIHAVTESDIVDYSPRIRGNTAFSSLSGDTSNGDWVLKVTDFDNGDEGELYAWGLQVNGSVIISNDDTGGDDTNDDDQTNDDNNDDNTEDSVSTSVGAHLKAEHNDAVVYPNPGKAVFYFDTKEEHPDGLLVVYNAKGQVVNKLSVANKVVPVNLSDQEKGIYLFRYVSGTGGWIQKKVLLNK